MLNLRVSRCRIRDSYSERLSTCGSIAYTELIVCGGDLTTIYNNLKNNIKIINIKNNEYSISAKKYLICTAESERN